MVKQLDILVWTSTTAHPGPSDSSACIEAVTPVTHSNSTALGFRCQLDSIGGSQRSPREDSYLINKVSSTLTSLGPKKCSRSSIGDLGKEVALGGDIARRRDDTESESRFSAQPLPGQFRSLSDMRCCAIYYEVTACSCSIVGSEGEHVALG